MLLAPATQRPEVAGQFGGRPLLLDASDGETIATSAGSVPDLDVRVGN